MEDTDAARHRFELFLHGRLDRAVLAMDRSLRRAKGIFEYCEDERCILRIAVVASEARILLPDGVEILPKDPIVDLHFWNERLPNLRQAGSSLAWGGMFRARMRDSLRLLAAYLDANPDLAEVKACRARTAFFRRRRLRSVGRRLGFVEAVPKESLWDQTHEFLETFLIYSLHWVFNPNAPSSQAHLPQRAYLWMSREELFRRYASRLSGQPVSAGKAVARLEACEENPAAS